MILLQCKRLKIQNLAFMEESPERIDLFVVQWNGRAHPFKWTTTTVARDIIYAQSLKEAAS